MQNQQSQSYTNSAYEPRVQLVRPMRRADFSTSWSRPTRKLSTASIRASFDTKSLLEQSNLISSLQRSLIRNQPDLMTSTGMTKPNSSLRLI